MNRGRGLILLFWFSVLFCLVLAVQASRCAQALLGVVVRERALHDGAARLSRSAQELKRSVDYGNSLSAQMAFLQSLPTLLPEQARFVRTQKVLQEEVGALRREVGRRLARSIYLLVDTKVNKLYVKKGMELLLEANCSVGRGGQLVDKATGRVWDFATPKGVFSVLWKTQNPVWIKPDWAFVEARQPVPPPDDSSRMVQGELGQYLLSIGHGYLIHGTKDEKSLGRPVSHGCVRLGAEDLEKVYELAPVGTKVYVY